jgi:hypothetical protein
MREDAYPKEMMFRDCNVFGAGGSYYPGSVIDEFMENELYNMYSDGMQSIIKNVPVKIHSKKYISKFLCLSMQCLKQLIDMSSHLLFPNVKATICLKNAI